MNYTLHQLEIFHEVVTQGSITRAAEELNMTQPALSIQLKNFQRQFDIPLVEVIGKRLYITEFGQTIASIAANILAEAESIKYQTRAYHGLLTGTLRISSASTGKYVAPYYLSGFVSRNKEVDLMLDVSNKAAVLRHLADYDVDFALVSVLPVGMQVYEEILIENHLYMVANSPELGEDSPLIFREEGSATRMAMDRHFGDPEGVKSMTLTSNEAVKQALIAGLGRSVLPLIGLRNELASGELQIIPVTGLPIVTNWRLIWLKSKKLTPVAEAFLAYVRENKQQIAEDYFGWCKDYSAVKK